MEIYLARDGTQSGPYSVEQLNELLATEQITGEDQYWYEGCAGWLPLRGFPGYKAPDESSTGATLNAPTATVPTAGRAAAGTSSPKAVRTSPASTPQAAAKVPSGLGLPRIWNPDTATLWSVLLGPLFGSVLVILNWRELGERQRAWKAGAWAAAALVTVCVAGAVTSPVTAGLNLALLLAWYFLMARPQDAFLVKLLGRYQRRSFVPPVAIAGVCVLALVFLPSFLQEHVGAVATVKHGMLPLDRSITIGEALDRYRFFDTKSWRSFQTDNGRTVVEFKGFIPMDSVTGEDVARTMAEGGTPAVESVKAAAAQLAHLGTKIRGLSVLVQFMMNKDETFTVRYVSTEPIRLSGKDIAVDPDSDLGRRQAAIAEVLGTGGDLALRQIYENRILVDVVALCESEGEAR